MFSIDFQMLIILTCIVYLYVIFVQVADFGLAKLALDTDTHVSTRVMGTFG